MKRSLLTVICTVLVFVVVFGSIGGYRYLKRLEAKPFDLDSDSLKGYLLSGIEEFPSDVVFGEITSAKDARKKAEKLLIELYGEKEIKCQRPLLVYYDEQKDLWLVEGTFRLQILNNLVERIGVVSGVFYPYLGAKGGVAYMLIRGSDGDVLTVFNTQ